MRKTVLMGMGLALSLATAAMAQQGDRPGARRDGDRGGPRGAMRGHGEGMLLQGITLTDAQKEQVKQLRESEHAKMEANRDQMKKQFDEARAARQRGDTAAARAIMERTRAAMEQARDQHIAAVRNILTAEQRVQFDKNVAEFKERVKDRQGGPMRRDMQTRRQNRGAQALFNGITLTDAQKTQLKELRQAQRDQLRQKSDSVRTQRVAAIRNILTPEQRVQFDKNLTQLKEREGTRGRGRRSQQGA